MKQCLWEKRQQYKGVGENSECHSDSPKFSSVHSAKLKAITAIMHLFWVNSHNLSVTKKQMSNHLIFPVHIKSDSIRFPQSIDFVITESNSFAYQIPHTYIHIDIQMYIYVHKYIYILIYIVTSF